MENGTEALAGDIAAARAKKRSLALIIASALVAARVDILPEALPLIVVEGPSPSRALTYAVRTDRSAAYRAAGEAAGTYLATLSQSSIALPPERPSRAPEPASSGPASGVTAAIRGKTGDLRPACGIVFSPGFARPESLLAEFEEGYRKGYLAASPKPEPGNGEPPLPLVERISTAGARDPAQSTVDFIDYTGETDSAVNRLLGRNVRLIFFACGRIQEAARAAESHPKIIFGIDETVDATVPGMAFRIIPDEKSLARTLRKMRDLILSGRPPLAAASTVPAMLVSAAPVASGAEAASFRTALRKARRVK
jgi:hypothetical protein